MHPLLLHQLADDTVTDRHRHARVQGRGRQSAGATVRPASRLRVRAGSLLIAVGTRLAGTRANPAVLHRHTSAPS
jgi:hypothetical protein